MPFKPNTSWEELLRGKWVILDADAIISCISLNALDLFERLTELGVKLTYTHSVYLELMNTNSGAERAQRSALLIRYKIEELPFNNVERDNAARIQLSLPLRCNPSPSDLYLGGSLARYEQGKVFVLTANAKDFPMPIYTREDFIPLYSEVSVKALSIIGLDKSKLVTL